MKSQTKLILAGVAFRLILLLYSIIQDQTNLKYTDIDYLVLKDAAGFLPNPYQRATYRYTPLLAILMYPSLYLNLFGKILFISCDVLTGLLILKLLKKLNIGQASALNLTAYIWILNPFVAIISTRGNAESILSLLVTSTLYLLSTNRVVLSAMVYGLSVHFKMYPIIYAIPIYFGIDHYINSFSSKSQTKFEFKWFGYKRILFGITGLATLVALNWMMYRYYGEEFLQHTYYYHLTRSDHRHNFSIYFLSMYLDSAPLLAFVPQGILVLALGIGLASDLHLAFFLQTFAFVILNKVMTSQYFIWYICYLPLVIAKSNLQVKGRLCLFIGIMWFLGQGIWLFFAYQLEFNGRNTFIPLFLASIGFFAIQVWIIIVFIKNR